MNKITATRYHDISTGHRVVGHENKCRHFHGHNYRIHFECEAENLDELGRVIDFGVIKEKLCMWVEHNWDHKFLAWIEDPLMLNIVNLSSCLDLDIHDELILSQSVVFLSFNPTAENMAMHLVRVVAPQVLNGTGVTLVSVKIEETAKCCATYSRSE